MASRIPRFMLRAGWNVVEGYRRFLEDDDLGALRDSITELGQAMSRDPASVLYAPEPLLLAWLEDKD